jgi:hypothetical protein
MSKTKQQSLFKSKIYCIDASSIINLFHPRGAPYPPYPFDVFEGLWQKLEQIIKNGQLISHTTVFKEVSERDDDAKKWCKKHKNIFKDIDDCQIEQIEIIKTKYSKSHWEAEINRKGQEWADPWIIALAICEDAIIVSDERNSPDRIPFIASHFEIRTLNLMDFFKDIGLKLKI